MGTTIDSLQIEINAKAKSANTAIDSLVSKLNKLSSSIGRVDKSNISNFTYGMDRMSKSIRNTNSVNVNGFSRLAKNITALSSANTSGLTSAANNLSQFAVAINNIGPISENSIKIGELARNIAMLGGANVQRAANNIPKLSVALSNLMKTLSKSPKVSQNLIDMTNALANLSAQGSKVGSASNSMQKGLNKAFASATNARKSFSGLASAIGKFYATYFMVIRGLKSLWGSIESTADYLEAYNYFNVALGKIGSDWSHNFKEYGYDNAQSYANSFEKRLKERLGGLSGIEIRTDSEGGGLLTETGLRNLGLNIQEVTQYASQLASVTNSIGQTGEVSLATASAFTKLGADISSLFNIDYSMAMNNLQSGLIGQSRALYKYGIDITNATLQTYAYGLEVDKAVSEMTQAEKMQLRMIAILDQSKVAWGDLANTINSPSNMLRQFKNNLKEAGMVLGQLFIPILQKVLPIINGAAIAIKRLLVSIAGIMGIKLNLGDFGKGAGDFGEELGEIDEGLGDIAESAQKAKAGLRGFDELNAINMSKSSGGGNIGGGIDLSDDILKAAEEYEKVWREAFEKMEQKARQFADAFERIAIPIKKLFADIVAGDWFAVGKDVSNLVVGIFNFVQKAIASVNWYKVGQNVGLFFAGIDWLKILSSVGKAVWEALMGALELWQGMFSTAPIETALISLIALPKLFTALSSSKIVSGVKNLAGNTKNLLSSLSNGKKNIKEFSSNLTGLQKGVIGAGAAVAEFLLFEDAFYDMASGADHLAASIGQIAIAGGVAGTALYTVFGKTGIVIAGITGAVAAIAGINRAFEEVRAKEIGESIRNAFENPGGVPLKVITDNFANSLYEAANGFNEISEQSNQMDSVQSNIEDTWREIEKIETAMENGVLSVEEGKKELEKLFGELAVLTEQKFSTITNTLLTAYGKDGALAQAIEARGGDVDAINDAVISVQYKSAERAKEIVEELAQTDVGSERYNELSIELAALSNEMGSLDKAANNFSLTMEELAGNIDYSELFDENGVLNATLLDSYLNNVTGAISDYETSLDEASKEIYSYWQEIYNSTASTDEQKALAKEQMEVLPGIIDQMKNDAREEALALTDVLQYEFIHRTDQIIDDAVDNYEARGGLTKLWMSVLGKKNDVQKAIEQHQNNVNELDKAIQESYGKLGISGANYASDSMDNIYNTLFSYKTSEYESVISAETDEINKNLESKGRDSVSFYNNGVKDSIPLAIDAVKEFASKSMEGITSQKNQFEEAGGNIVEGLLEGIGLKESELYAKLEEIAKKIKETFNLTMGIQSPSKVMKESGSYVMQGLQLGMESWRNNIIETASSFGKEIEAAINPSFSVSRSGIVPAYSSASSVSGVYVGNTTATIDNAETNGLLTELISAVREGRIIRMNARDVGMEIREEDKKYYNRTGTGMFEHRRPLR